MTETAKTFLAAGPASAASPPRTVLPQARRLPPPFGRAQDQEVVVQLGDRTLKGKLAGADEFINLYLEDVEETLNGATRKLPRAVVRGSQVIAIHATKLGPPIVEPRGETVWSDGRSNRGGYYPSRRDDGRGRDLRHSPAFSSLPVSWTGDCIPHGAKRRRLSRSGPTSPVPRL